MRKAIHFLAACLLLLSATSCDDFFNVHEWPENAETESIVLRLAYDTEMTEWNHTYDESTVSETGLGETYDNSQESGVVRYVVRLFPAKDGARTSQSYTKQLSFTQDISEGYDTEVTLDVAPGEYQVMVWSDLVENSSDTRFYYVEDFAEITLQGDEHYGNNDYRDAFRGDGMISLEATVEEHAPDTLTVSMERPLAKYEFITTDLAEFIEKQELALEAAMSESGDKEYTNTKVSVGDYKAVFYYSGFMPSAYSMFTDKPVDSSTGVQFEATLEQLSESEASFGFDYVFVNGDESSVTVQIAIYNREGTQLFLTNSIRVPLKRSYHTVVRGKFLASEAAGGVSVNPSYDGEYNIYYE